MSTQEHAWGRRERWILYSVIAVLLVALAVIAMAAWRGAKQTREAEQKADRLVAAFGEAGASSVPSRERIVRVLGTDGGPVCADPTGALNRAAYLTGLSNGAGGPGARPVIADSKLVHAELAVIAIYCPDKLSEFEEFVDDLRTADLSGE